MFKALITEFPLSDVPKERTITEEKIRKYTYTKEEVDVLISNAVREAVEEAKKIDEESMAKHNRDATVISMILGFTTLALFVDGLLRMLGIIPPFMEIDINILDKIETDIIDRVKQVPIQKIFHQVSDERHFGFYISHVFCSRVWYDLCIHGMMMRSTLSEFDKRPVKSFGDAMRPYRPPAPHPEMEGVKTGEELLVFTRGRRGGR